MVVAAIRENRFYILTHPQDAAAFLRSKLRLMEIAELTGSNV
jgi:hypothetical protein